jgi:hypothetical protein
MGPMERWTSSMALVLDVQIEGTMEIGWGLTMITGHRSRAETLAKEVGSEVWYGAGIFDEWDIAPS